VKPALLDTGVIVALLDRSEKFHQTCSEAVRSLEAPLITCEAVIAESCYLLRNLPGAPEAVIENVVGGIFQLPFQLSREAAAVKQVLRIPRFSTRSCCHFCPSRFAPKTNIWLQVLHHFLELHDVQRLRAVTDGFFRRRMHFHD
jgi:uncharacterized protein